MENGNGKVIVIGAKRFDFVDDSGRRVAGTKVHFLVPDQAENDAVGYIPKSAVLPLDAYADMERLQYPFEADVVTESWFGAKQVQTRIRSFEYLSSLQFS
ncbi:hypothetical protein [Parageobacillus thermoglucosidasius]|uniref:hypothetical protein n=1 Tax=Parageobacillus thermoglucosidasius TaxID=1426 RepID=UPI002430A4B9|nr:hypothetical protein [Parageobacillus thermoglucosidasius]MBY6269937.1 hypothetical protein [Parageobacillus thermoglucosidasius]